MTYVIVLIIFALVVMGLAHFFWSVSSEAGRSVARRDRVRRRVKRQFRQMRRVQLNRWEKAIEEHLAAGDHRSLRDFYEPNRLVPPPGTGYPAPVENPELFWRLERWYDALEEGRTPTDPAEYGLVWRYWRYVLAPETSKSEQPSPSTPKAAREEPKTTTTKHTSPAQRRRGGRGKSSNKPPPIFPGQAVRVGDGKKPSASDREEDKAVARSVAESGHQVQQRGATLMASYYDQFIEDLLSTSSWMRDKRPAIVEAVRERMVRHVEMFGTIDGVRLSRDWVDRLVRIIREDGVIPAFVPEGVETEFEPFHKWGKVFWYVPLAMVRNAGLMPVILEQQGLSIPAGDDRRFRIFVDFDRVYDEPITDPCEWIPDDERKWFPDPINDAWMELEVRMDDEESSDEESDVDFGEGTYVHIYEVHVDEDVGFHLEIVEAILDVWLPVIEEYRGEPTLGLRMPGQRGFIRSFDSIETLIAWVDTYPLDEDLPLNERQMHGGDSGYEAESSPSTMNLDPESLSVAEVLEILDSPDCPAEFVEALPDSPSVGGHDWGTPECQPIERALATHPKLRLEHLKSLWEIYTEYDHMHPDPDLPVLVLANPNCPDDLLHSDKALEAVQTEGVSLAALKTLAAAPRTPQRLRSELNELEAPERVRREAIERKKDRRTSGAPKQILVVEGERDIAALVAYHLTKDGYRVRTVATGDDAMEAVRGERPDLVILDLMLEGVSADEVLKEIRESPDMEQVPVIALTVRAEESEEVEALELGADDYLNKPFSPKELVLRVGEALRRKRAAVSQSDESAVEIEGKSSDATAPVDHHIAELPAGLYSDSLRRKEVALSSECDATTLERLLGDEYRWVRQAAAANQVLTTERIRELSNSNDRYVLSGLAVNSNCPTALAQAISARLEDEDQYPRESDTYLLGYDCPVYAQESYAGEVSLDEVVECLVTEDGSWSSYMWGSDWWGRPDYWHTHGVRDVATAVQYPNGEIESICLESDVDPDPPDLLDEIPNTGCGFAMHVELGEKAHDGWLNWKKYAADLEYEFRPEFVEPIYDDGICFAYRYDAPTLDGTGESAFFGSDGKYWTEGKGSDFSLYHYNDGELELLDLEWILEEMEEAGIALEDRAAVESYVRRRFLDSQAQSQEDKPRSEEQKDVAARTKSPDSAEPGGLPDSWQEIAEGVGWPLAQVVAEACYREMPKEPDSQNRFSGFRKGFKGCDWVNVIFRQQYLSLYIKSDRSDWEEMLEAEYGVEPEVRSWKDGVQIRARTEEEVRAVCSWMEVDLDA